ncbi:hypothetical protein [Paraburkholderia sp. CNPSo 3281]|uniref:hypothetical protein n=1 Tax=Paraburkholderia sp. CNPSo 3281 TaxID=2940933 RepID=UPI0020B7B617|nr:hypothetical protein [Paraburkholderia sp. CNPSo 3281]MCP3719873.1 hypothetical protein [Paraburkholderia sp. CNPSo 3281]
MAENVSASNVISDVTQTLQTFDLLELQQYTREKSYSSTASKDFHLFYVGRDDVHNILKYVLSRASVSLYMNMFGFDDEELNEILMQQALDPTITMMITLGSASGEGTFVIKGAPGGPGYLAQNNTQTIFTDPDTINRFQTELIAEHMTAKAQGYTVAAASTTKTAAKTTATAAVAKKSVAAAKRSKRN